MAHRREAGLSLVELMVALLLLGLLSAAVVLSLPPPGGRLEADAATLAARLEDAARRSVIAGETIGVTFDDAGYTLLRLEAARWISAGAERHLWSAPLTITVERGGAVGPPLRFDAAGIVTPFRLSLARDGERVRLSVADFGAIWLEAGDA